MREREILQERSRARLEIWERKVRRLFEAAHVAGTKEAGQHLRELVDRRDAVRIKLEKMRRASEPRFAEARRELEQAFSGLRQAWDGAVAKLGWTGPVRERQGT